VRKSPLPSYTVRLESPEHDESDRALRAARAGGSEPVVLTCGPREIADAYPRLIHAAESPVTDASSATLLLLAARGRADGHRAVLAGDGADDLFAGYPWFKADRLMGLLDWIPGVTVSQLIRRLYLRIAAPMVPWANVKRIHAIVGRHHAWLDLYGLVARGKFLFYSDRTREQLGGRFAYDDLKFDTARMSRWHPLNQNLYFGLKMHVPGLLLQAKGDRLAAQSGVQLRHPFLDEEVVALAARLHPDWKLRRLRDKYVLRGVAQRYLPHDIAWRPKSDFVAPFDTLFAPGAPPFVEELLSEESLRRSG
jgi:asparagine synthase (glutamine-hydrolysing)